MELPPFVEIWKIECDDKKSSGTVELCVTRW